MLTKEKNFWGAWGQTNALYTRWADAEGVNYYLLLVLYTLDGQDPMTQKRICGCTGLNKQTVNSVIRTLKNEGYVTLTPGQGDRREKQVALSEEGVVYSQALLAPLYDLEQTVSRILGPERMEQMVDALTLFNLVFETEMEKKLT